MARKSNKTSHVLNLLAGEEPVPETTEDKEETAKPQESVTEQEAEPDAPNISIVSSGNSEGDPLADLIKEQLEEDFPEEILNTQPADHDSETDNAAVVDAVPPAKESEDISSAESAQTGPAKEPEEPEAIPSAEPVQTEAPEKSEELPHTDDTKPSDSSAETGDAAPPQPDSSPNTGADQPSSATDTSSPTHYRFINVMEYIVKDLVLDYMQKFDMCTCERCRVDMMALALTNCPAKYIVVDNHTVSPLLNYYSNKYMNTVTVELIKACTIIKENPRH